LKYEFFSVVIRTLSDHAHNLKHGPNREGLQSCLIRLDTKVMNKVLGCLTRLELESFVQQIAAAVENPGDTPLCEL